jgi:hypothetical protein
VPSGRAGLLEKLLQFHHHRKAVALMGSRRSASKVRWSFGARPSPRSILPDKVIPECRTFRNHQRRIFGSMIHPRPPDGAGARMLIDRRRRAAMPTIL